IFNLNKAIYFFGDGMPKIKKLLQNNKSSFFIEDVVPSAKNMATLALAKFLAKQFEDVAYFEPFYLKEFFTNTKIQP
ncbi:MAG TPA: tRNA (adenosine(37)-N6)-threonylcarbamoyltransferase complex dimerization subunit type 1 TsaB, partial [Bacteroidia bacterium]|nr:tRNA (adenosine(37)-N6)-threonylcarbamoyltransferase complex dimerization subunit type 1 TsaB [Bacteroidia bacterium]